MKKEKNEVSWTRIWTGSMIAALIAAVAVFFVMLQLEKNMLTKYEKGSTLAVKEPLYKGEQITEENWQKYFSVVELDKERIPKSGFISPEELIGKVAGFDMEKDVLVTESMFTDRKEVVEKMDEPVIAGIKAEDIYQLAGGILRAGDRIHIYNVDMDGRAQLVWPDILVQKVFDASGNNIPNADLSTAVYRLNVYLDKKDVEQFYTGIHTGTIRVVKVYDGWER